MKVSNCLYISMGAPVSQQCLTGGFQERCKGLFFKTCQGKPEGPAKSGSDIAKSQPYRSLSFPPPGHSLEVKWVWMSLSLYLCSLQADLSYGLVPQTAGGSSLLWEVPLLARGPGLPRNLFRGPQETSTFSTTFVPTGNSRLFWRPS